MDLKYLTTFQTIVEEGSFAKAAEKLHYTQSTITFQIGQLEQELSAQLFEKIGRSMALTKAGELLLPYVEGVLSSVERMRLFEKDLAQCQGDLTIGVGETLLCYRLPPILKAFHQRAPKARLFLRSMNCHHIRDQLLSGALDLGVFYQDVGGFGSSLITTPLGDCALALVASPPMAGAFPDFITPDRQMPVPFVINEAGCVFRQMFENYLRQKAIRLDHTIELWSIPTIKNLVKNDVGVTYLPLFAVEKELRSGELVQIPLDMGDARIHATLAHHKNKWVSPLMALFTELCGSMGLGSGP